MLCQSLRRCALAWALVVTAASTLVGSALAAPDASDAADAEQLVKEALHREIYGQTNDRQKLLDKAIEAAPDYAPARWHKGYVRVDGKWIPAEEAPELADEDRRLAAYKHFRDQRADTVAGHMEVAQWCRKKGLAAQEQAHLTRVIDLNPDHVEARARLGFRRIGAQWVSSEEIAEAQQIQRECQQGLSEWRGELEDCLKGLEHRSEARREAAAKKIRSFREPGAVYGLEAFVCTHSEEAAMLALEAMGAIDTQESTLALARQSILSPSIKVRRAAAKLLAERPMDTYVPVLLSEMYTPARSMTQMAPGPRGRLIYRHSFIREGQDERQHMVLDTSFRRVRTGNGSAAFASSMAVSSAADTAATREQALRQQNMATELVNERICSTLNYITEQNLASSPENWWNWWNDLNEVFMEGEKPIKTLYTASEVGVADGIATASPGGGRKDCLLAGTQVWTASGPVAVEKIEVGDLVLAQHPETGELAYQPVLRTTVRPKGKLVRVSTSSDEIQTSGGHLFWVSGEGWVKARNLQSGHEIHGVTRTVRVVAVEEGVEAETYNLVVGDFHTYFVGEGKILCHDNTIHRPTDAVVPGLSE